MGGGGKGEGMIEATIKSMIHDMWFQHPKLHVLFLGWMVLSFICYNTYVHNVHNARRKNKLVSWQRTSIN
jgi:hypothetical protein